VLEIIKEFLQMGTVVLDKTIGKNVSHLIKLLLILEI
jgi:hypothetical protein